MKLFVNILLVGTATTFLVSGLFYQILFASAFAEGLRPFGSLANHNPDLMLIFINHGIASLLMTLIIIKQDIRTLRSSLLYSVPIGFLLSVYVAFWFIVSFNCMSSTYAIATITAHTIQTAVATFAMVWVRNRMTMARVKSRSAV